MPPVVLAHPLRIAVALLAAVAATAVLLPVYWPAGVFVGGSVGVFGVLAIGLVMHRSAAAPPIDRELADLLGVPDAAPAKATERQGPPRTPEPVAGRSTAASTPPRAVPAPGRAPAAPPVTPAPPRIAAAPSAPEPAAAPSPVPPRPRAAKPESATPASGKPAAAAAPRAAAPTGAVAAARGVRADLARVKQQLGDDFPDFARAARLVVSTQYASAARLQRELQVPYSRARRLISGLESEHFVGPATGSLPRQVLLPRDRLPDVERLFADV